MVGHHKWSDIKRRRSESQQANRESIARQLGGGSPPTVPSMTPLPRRSVAGGLDASAKKFCGVAIVGVDEYPCVLEDQHVGFCDFGPDYQAAVLQRFTVEPPPGAKVEAPPQPVPSKPDRAAKVYQPVIHLKAKTAGTTPTPACGRTATVVVTNVKKVTCGRCQKTEFYKEKMAAAVTRDNNRNLKG